MSLSQPLNQFAQNLGRYQFGNAISLYLVVIPMRLGKGMIMQSDNSHHEAHQNDLNYSSEYQYDMYMYAEYGIEW